MGHLILVELKKFYYDGKTNREKRLFRCFKTSLSKGGKTLEEGEFFSSLTLRKFDSI